MTTMFTRIFILLLALAIASPLSAAPAEKGPTGNAALDQAIKAVVKIEAKITAGGRTVKGLGAERDGHGVVIDEKGLVLTIGYLILEAESVTVTTSDGKKVPASFVAYDHNTGFGLVRAFKSLGVKPIKFGNSDHTKIDQVLLVVGHGGGFNASPARLVSRRDYAGYWEYLLENALFTAPPFDAFGGAALIDETGRLIGIGSLVVANAVDPDAITPGNMFVPINALKPILGDMLAGQMPPGRNRPWIGIHTTELQARVFVVRTSKGGPAQTAGIQDGDILISVGSQPIKSQMDFYRKLWEVGPAGSDVPITVLTREQGIKNLTVKSINRYQWLKLPTGN
jgi:serine protease Do